MMDGNIFPNGHSKFEIHVRYPSRNNEKKKEQIYNNNSENFFIFHSKNAIYSAAGLFILHFVSAMRVFYK